MNVFSVVRQHLVVRSTCRMSLQPMLLFIVVTFTSPVRYCHWFCCSNRPFFRLPSVPTKHWNPQTMNMFKYFTETCIHQDFTFPVLCCRFHERCTTKTFYQSRRAQKEKEKANKKGNELNRMIFYKDFITKITVTTTIIFYCRYCNWIERITRKLYNGFRLLDSLSLRMKFDWRANNIFWGKDARNYLYLFFSGLDRVFYVNFLYCFNVIQGNFWFCWKFKRISKIRTRKNMFIVFKNVKNSLFPFVCLPKDTS